jgi:hypothetical protein
VSSNVASWEGKSGSFSAAESDAPGFIRPANVHHWAYTERNLPHLWMGASELGFATLEESTFRSGADTLAAAKFNHLRGLVLGDGANAGYQSATQPDLARFHRLDERIRYLNQKGIVADLVLANGPAGLASLFPSRDDRRRFIRYVAGRFAALNITWELVDHFEDDPDGRALLSEMGNALKDADPYQHPRTAGARVTSAPLLDDKWMTFAAYGTTDDAIGAVEHQLFAVPFVNLAVGRKTNGADPATLRRSLWNATMDGQYVTYAGAASDATAAKQMSVWFDVLADTRHWELEPYFDVDGGRAVALEGVEYLVYMEKPGPIELQVEKHGYDVLWIDPADGEVTRRKFNGDHFTGEPPDKSHDWVLRVAREGRIESMGKSYKFESREILLQEIEQSPDKVPFAIDQPASAADVKIGQSVAYRAKIKRDTRATRSVLWVWTGEVAADGLGYRVLATGQSGNFTVPDGLAKNYPAVLHIRLFAMNSNGKVYALDRTLEVNR